jgi:hypothetical protein
VTNMEKMQQTVAKWKAEIAAAPSHKAPHLATNAASRIGRLAAMVEQGEDLPSWAEGIDYATLRMVEDEFRAMLLPSYKTVNNMARMAAGLPAS